MIMELLILIGIMTIVGGFLGEYIENNKNPSIFIILVTILIIIIFLSYMMNEMNTELKDKENDKKYYSELETFCKHYNMSEAHIFGGGYYCYEWINDTKVTKKVIFLDRRYGWSE